MEKFFNLNMGRIHGEGYGVVIDGCPAGLAIDEGNSAVFKQEKTRPNKVSTPRKKRTRSGSCQAFSRKNHGNPYFHDSVQ